MFGFPHQRVFLSSRNSSASSATTSLKSCACADARETEAVVLDLVGPSVARRLVAAGAVDARRRPTGKQTAPKLKRSRHADRNNRPWSSYDLGPDVLTVKRPHIISFLAIPEAPASAQTGHLYIGIVSVADTTEDFTSQSIGTRIHFLNHHVDDWKVGNAGPHAARELIPSAPPIRCFTYQVMHAMRQHAAGQDAECHYTRPDLN
jgi:hypothetical protein